MMLVEKMTDVQSKFHWDRILNNKDQDAIELGWEKVLKISPLDKGVSEEYRKLKPSVIIYYEEQFWNTLNFILDALGKAFLPIKKIRKHGMQNSSHAQGHAAVSLFRKIIEMLECHLVHHLYNGNALFFKEKLQEQIKALKQSFTPIDHILTAGVTIRSSTDEELTPKNSPYLEVLHRREKQILLRAYFPEFEQTFDDFQSYNWTEEWQAFYSYALIQYKCKSSKLNIETEITKTLNGDVSQ